METSKEQRNFTSVDLKVPRMVEENEFKILHRLVARINVKYVGNGLFLGYCKHHKSYFVDYKHTNGNIRCPVCDEKWLINHGFLKRAHFEIF